MTVDLCHVVGIPHSPKRAKTPKPASRSVRSPATNQRPFFCQNPQTRTFSPSLNLSAKPESAAPHHRAHVALVMLNSPQQLWRIWRVSILMGARPAEGSLCPVNQVTLAVQQGDAVQDRRESRSSLRPSLSIHSCPVGPRARAAFD